MGNVATTAGKNRTSGAAAGMTDPSRDRLRLAAQRTYSRCSERCRAEVRVRGRVQGIGFRPWVYRTAIALGLCGEVENTKQGVRIVLDGSEQAVQQFLDHLRHSPPPLAEIHRLDVQYTTDLSTSYSGFYIRESMSQGEVVTWIPPDLAVCEECKKEIHDPAARRFRYPFTNCTHCGPRYTIVYRLPYDRVNTSMHAFPLCEACGAEYENPLDRRFHAEPIACPTCGPHLVLWDAAGTPLTEREEALTQAADAIKSGAIVAVKGLGGFHLIVNASDPAAVQRLRQRKHREAKPFALMYPGMAEIEADCEICPTEREILQSYVAPIVLVRRKSAGGRIAENVAPGMTTLGVMLPYTPLHVLLMEEIGAPVVATSGNISEEPICTDEHEALQRLRNIADFFLVHNRPIVRPVDDSVVRIVNGDVMVLRRARGYAPQPISLNATSTSSVLGVGGHLKNTVAVNKDSYVFLSQHIGDMENARAYSLFIETVQKTEELFACRPSRVVADKHPDYPTAVYAQSLGLTTEFVQHHAAHALACMAEHGISGPVFAVVWDGTGYGEDGTVWGGEFLHVSPCEARRLGHLRTFRLPGGEAALREPRRSLLGLLYEIYGEHAVEIAAVQRVFTARERNVLCRLLTRQTNAPTTSSVGRLFDAVACLVGIASVNHFEGQAAMLLEQAAQIYNATVLPYPIRWGKDADMFVWDWEPMVKALLQEQASGASASLIAARFHATLVQVIQEAVQHAPTLPVVLSGGCFQNARLLEESVRRLREHGVTVHYPKGVPPNDGGIALGQVYYGIARAATEVSSSPHAATQDVTQRPTEDFPYVSSHSR